MIVTAVVANTKIFFPCVDRLQDTKPSSASRGLQAEKCVTILFLIGSPILALSWSVLAQLIPSLELCEARFALSDYFGLVLIIL